jgi:hypothetical protein
LSSSTRDSAGLILAILLGVTAFLVYCGWWPLIPTNIAWLDSGDRAMHQLGWMFYRQADWGIPPGRSPLLGIEISNSIALVDGLPLFAIPFKLIAQWLPEPFQYWGYWLLLSFILQSVFACRVARELGAGRVVALLCAAFVLITPTYLFRVPMHLALSGHWTILAALFLYVRREPPRLWMWPLLIALTCAIHATLLAMVLALWAAALAQRLWARRARLVTLVGETGIAIIAALAVLWTVGFFGTGSYASYGYGAYKLNLLWPIISHGWSQVFPSLPHTHFDYEGLSFLGIGILALLVLAIVTGAIARLRNAASRYWLPLTLMLVALMVFAFSKSLSILDTDLATIPVPGFIEAIGSAFRSTGRFVWPMLYFVTIGAVVLVAQRLRAAIALPVILVALGAQVWDSWPKLHEFAAHMRSPASTWSTNLKSPLWDRAAKAGYDRVRAIPVRQGFGTDWKALGYYAVTHHMDTDIAYLGRVDDDALDTLRLAGEFTLVTGNFEPKTIYILDVRTSLLAARQAALNDLIAVVDGRIVFLPGGVALGEGLDRWSGD